MIPTRLTLSNFMCYRVDGAADDPAPLDLDGLHVVCLSGENGAGKSALLDAITWALWGEARMADDDLIAQGQGEMFVELEFRLGELDYRVRRARQRGGTGKRGGQSPGKSQLDLQVRNGAGWRALSESGVRETQAVIDGVLRMSYQTFINASFLLQGRADEFTARTPSERKEVLADILDLSEYEALAQRAKDQAKGLADSLMGLGGQLDQLAAEAGKLFFWQREVEDAEARRAALAERAAAAEVECQVADEARRALEQQAEQRKALLRRLDELRRELVDHERELAGLRQRIARDEAILGRGETIRAGLAALARARAEVEQLGAARRQYDELSRRQAELRQQFADAKNELREQLRGAEAQAEALSRRADRREQLRSELAGLARRDQDLAGVADEHARCTEGRQALTVQLERINDRLRLRDELQARVRLRIDSLVAVRESRREAIARLEQQLSDEPRWRRELELARADRLRLAEGEARLAELRDQERSAVDLVTTLRAACQSTQAEAEKLKRNKALLDGEVRTCPVCRSDLGPTGVARAHAHYDEELAALRGHYAAARREADQGEGRLKTTRAALAELDRSLPGLRSSAVRIESLEAQLAMAARWCAERDALRAEYEDLRRQIEEGAVEPAAQAELAAVTAELAALGDAVELAQDRAMLDERLADLAQRLQERDKIAGTRAAYTDELGHIEADLDELPALQQRAGELRRVIEANDFAHAVRDEGQQVKVAIEALGYSSEALREAEERSGELRHWEEEERALALAEQRLSGDRESLRKSELLQQRAAEELARLEHDETMLAEGLRRLPALVARTEELRAALASSRAALSAAQRDLGEKAAYLKHAEQAARELEELRAEQRRLAERQGLFAELAEALGKKGVQAMLIEHAIPQIEDEANRLLGRMTDGQMHLSFEMQRETKKSGPPVETLELKIADALGTRVYDAFSGGEAMRVNFAVRIALSRLLAHRAGARLETLVIDEGFGTLDALGRERMIEAITSVQDDFRRIIVITHIDDLKDRFPALIEVTKTPHGSRWELR